ncbi:MAG: preprotein translocase subunit SecE [Desulfovibrionaceae bacterium]|nr:preprotein translocase subunit SecE [Desulfovibrionaceae bacterium]MBF0512774.1 preprotein translocase subunit SecE [Desulfovibrionaceae bacterium]
MANKKSKDAGAQAGEVREPRESAPAKSPSSFMAKIEEFKEFFELSKLEIKKVVWPTRKETVATGVAVLVLVVVMSLFLGIVDVSLAKLVEKILS